jgi:hypothetical protein
MRFTERSNTGSSIAQNVSESDVQFSGEIWDSPLELRVRA